MFGVKFSKSRKQFARDLNKVEKAMGEMKNHYKNFLEDTGTGFCFEDNMRDHCYRVKLPSGGPGPDTIVRVRRIVKNTKRFLYRRGIKKSNLTVEVFQD